MWSEELLRETFPGTVKQKITLPCDKCGKLQHCGLEKAVENVRKHGCYTCRSCVLKAVKSVNPVSDTHREKLREAGLKRTMSHETRQRISQSKKALYASKRGEELKKSLSLKASQQLRKGVAFGEHRKGYFHSYKNELPLFFASSYELRCLHLLEEDPSVIHLETQVPIICNEKGRCIDILATLKDMSKQLIEVKPSSRISSSHEQIRDLECYAKDQGFSFFLFTELDCGFTSERDLRNWAEQFLGTYKENESHRKRLNTERVKQNYHNNVREVKVTVFCEYCKENHTIMQLSYNRNVKKNGRYICHKENAVKQGESTSKPRENPYAEEGKKECACCHQVKPFADFGVDKSRRDGYASRCKECRSTEAMRKYYERKEINEGNEKS